MIKLERTSVMNIENAIRGARNPMNSWGKSDSVMCMMEETPVAVCGICSVYKSGKDCLDIEEETFIMGQNDLDLAKRLCKAGPDHRKFMRQIFVSVDITAPLYWWKEYDTYKVGTTANSCSTMHKIHSKPITIDDFSIDNDFKKEEDIADLADMWNEIIENLEMCRNLFIETKEKRYWRLLIQLLPSSYNQMRTCTMTYENLINMYYARKNHKLAEWREFCTWVGSLPYAKELICEQI